MERIQEYSRWCFWLARDHVRALPGWHHLNNYSRAIILLAVLAGCTAKSNTNDTPPVEGMVWIPGGDFVMGTNEDDAYSHERPAHKVHVDGFWMKATEVTNAEFRKFVNATGYKTIAERKPTWEELKKGLPPGTPQPPDSILIPGSLVFYHPKPPILTDDYSQWWMWVNGADWQHPDGPSSNLDGKDNHPVTHIAYEDALAYCKWEGTRLPTEAEWEFASRGGKESQRYGWGSEFSPGGKSMANTFQGSFPIYDLKEDGFDGTSPVKTFPANEYGLYDMIGNVWEWTSDLYDINYFQTLPVKEVTSNPRGPASSFDPNEPYATKRVTKGGSYLCASNYCSNYRPSSRQGSSIDSGSSNIGFRTIYTHP
ncbi:MAG TPA: formylglycine-generating enzyme family protein [Cyclobacteriaceae bacterium]|nr:formylglycine-generating enzyme family protein [Cyclobacteriaceae bacterium]